MTADQRPPSIDPVAAARWQRLPQPHSPWLHEEVARRMQQRLDGILLQPRQWLHWAPLQGGIEAHRLLRQRYPQATAWAMEPDAAPANVAALARRLDEAGKGDRGWLREAWSRVRGAQTHTTTPPPASMNMLWANMALHTSADPLALLGRWRDLLAVNGFVMCSALGPDTLRELRAVYAHRGWAPPGHQFTDMHDWGDMLVQAGFAEPVMDMERITLTFATPERALQELRELGRNLSVERDARTHGRRWRDELLAALESLRRDGQIALTFEIIYGHALKPLPRAGAGDTTVIPLQDVRGMLRQRR